MTAAIACLAIGLAFGYLATRTIGYERPIIVLARPSEQGIIEHPDGSRERHQWTAAQVSALLDRCQAQHRQIVRYADRVLGLETDQNESKRWQRALN